MTSSCNQKPLKFGSRRSQTLSNDRCQNILYKAVFEHFIEIKWIAVLLLASKSFQNSSFGANFLVNFVVDYYSILLLDSVLSPSSCLSIQLVPSLKIKQYGSDSAKIKLSIPKFVSELVNTKYFRSSLRSLTLDEFTADVLSLFFTSSGEAWPQLQELTFDNRGVKDSLLEIISEKAPQLRALTINVSSGVTDAGLEHLVKLSNITSLKFIWCDNISNAGLDHLGKLTGITSLDLSYCGSWVSDVSLEHISKLSGIADLNLASCRTITDAGLEHLSKLSGITSLNLDCCGEVTDAGLKHLSKLSRITNLHLIADDKITTDAKQKLKMALPNCVITDTE